jgi:hypothetical protein
VEGGIRPEDRMPPDQGATEPESLRILESKYYDWCSARLAERFLQLSPDEIYALAERGLAASERAGDAAGAAPGDATYRRLVELATEVLALELSLPDFASWVVDYRAAPERFDAEMLGMWRVRGDG